MRDTHWTIDALATAMTKALGREIERGYCWKLVNGEKPWRLDYTDALPDDLEARWAHLTAERHGLLVIERVDAATAQRHLASGLFNILTAQLPARADRMAKADVAVTEPLKAAR